MRTRLVPAKYVLLGLWTVLFAAGVSNAAELLMKDGRVLRGKMVPLTGVSAVPQIGGQDVMPEMIRMLDDDLRRTYVGLRQSTLRREEAGEVPEKFHLKQRTVNSGSKVVNAGPMFDVKPFDEYGRRRVKLATARRTEDVVQAITLITPHYVKVEGVTHVWDMRMATTSLPQDALERALRYAMAKADPEERKKVARFYLQCGRYEPAARELESLLAERPNDEALKQQLQPSLQLIRQAACREILGELKLRAEAGQHKLVTEMLQRFPAENSAPETIQAVREMLNDYEQRRGACSRTAKEVRETAGRIADEAVRKTLKPLLDEIENELNFDSLDRMAAFRESLGDAQAKPEERVALAVSGWIVGGKHASPQLTTTTSLIEVRRLIVKFFSGKNAVERAKTLGDFQSQETAGAAMVGRVLANMKPPLAPEPLEDEAKSYVLETAGREASPKVRYWVQLPPEYDPLRRYPAIVALHSLGMSPESQVDWWAGPLAKNGRRAGQASRRGYIVIAPAWTADRQGRYEYSSREHLAVLDSLRDASLRFSIDSDRVFLAGHAAGGDAAWDIGLSHPDLWAGVIPIAAKSDRYCTYYWRNAKHLPWYFVVGEIDPGRNVVAGATDWNRYFLQGYNTTLVEYLGRGHDDFSDEILRLFDWMARCRRDFFQKDFSVSTMRPWDNFFWWLELQRFSSRNIVEPADWSGRHGAQVAQTQGTVLKNGDINVKTAAGQVTVWLLPEMIDSNRRISITVNGRRIKSNATILPDLQTLLEDALTRGDRQHPFWAKVEARVGRGS